MNKFPVLIAASLVTIAVAIYNLGSMFSDWKDADYTSETFGSNLAYYIGEKFASEGLLYPSGDLDDPLLKHRKIVLTHAMNENTTKEVVRKLLYLNALDNTSPIDFYISTQGGWYNSAFTIIDAFYVIQAPVNTICIGGCYSAGLVLIASGTGVRTAYANSHLSVHLIYGEESDSQPFEKQPDRVNAYLRKVTSLPKSWFPLDDDRTYFLTADQALEYKIIDKIERKSS